MSSPSRRLAITDRRSGFTLIELMVVIVLLGAAATLITVRWQPATDAARLRGAAIEVETLVRSAQRWSRQTRRPSWLQFDGVQGKIGWRRGDEDAITDWRALRGLRIVDAGYVQVASPPPSRGHDTREVSIRINANGVTAPWWIELQAGARLLRLEHDGISPTLRLGSREVAAS